MANYEETVADFKRRLDSCAIGLRLTCEEKNDININSSVKAITDLEERVTIKYDKFKEVINSFRSYLEATRTEDSNVELLKTIEASNSMSVLVEEVTCYFDNIKQEIYESITKKSVSSCNSISPSVLKAKQAKAEALKARLIFAESEAKMKKEKAYLEEQEIIAAAESARKKLDIQAELDLLQEKKNIAEAEAEVEALGSQSGSRHSSLKEIPHIDALQRTATFVSEHSTPNLDQSRPQRGEQISELDPDAPIFMTARHTRDVDTNSRNNYGAANQFGQFLLKKEILLSRFTKFNDKPESYLIWKHTFENIVHDLQVTPLAELDLILKWLGPESSRQSANLRAANLGDPETSLKKIWARLNERYGAPELVENRLRKKLNTFPKLGYKDYDKMYDLLDILLEVESLKENPLYANMLGYFDSPVGVNPIIDKLPIHMQNKWTERGRKFKVTNSVTYPPFGNFVQFVSEMCSLHNDPSFIRETNTQKKHIDVLQNRPTRIHVNKGEVKETVHQCPLHKYANHTLDECREFKKEPIEKRRQCLKENRLCFRCCKAGHSIKDCKVPIKCLDCGSVKHMTCLHIASKPNVTHSEQLSSNCLKICGDASLSKSCAKILKVNVYHKDDPSIQKQMYAVIDDQSNKTLASTQFFDTFENSCEYREINYTLSSCSGKVATSGRTGQGFVIEGMNGSSFDLPVITECLEIPDNREEIPTPEVICKYPHLHHIIEEISKLDENCEIMLLIGRDLPEAHHIKDQIIGSDGPFAQLLNLGWVVIGETCVGSTHIPCINVKKTSLREGRHSILPACESKYTIKPHSTETHSLDLDIFLRSRDDNKVGLSVEDQIFLDIMNSTCKKDENGYWVAPLPFRENRPELPNNRDVALKRALYLDASLKRNPTKSKHFVEFMSKVLKSGAAEVAPMAVSSRIWYLPIFGVYHPKKPDKIRGVFDSSAICKGMSLNGTLLSGPNLVNSLLAVLLRFRQDKCAIMADIEQMFYSFLVKEEHRDYLRFFWYRNNNPNEALIEYRMCAHVFGNSPSPAVATYCLRKTVEDADSDVFDFVKNNFYVDDGLISLPDADDIISLMKRTQSCLKTANLRLHKIVSNNKHVMKSFPEEDLQSNLRSIHLDVDKLPVNQSLGLSWELNSDCFKFNIELEQKPFTRRGILSSLNSVYDPLGFVAPMIICGKMILREITAGCDWDEPLNPELESKWRSWRESLLSLDNFATSRMYVPQSLSTSVRKELHIFSDASEKAICAVAYVRVTMDNGDFSTGFVMGKCKLAPVHGHSVPRLELCAALVAAQLGETITESLSIAFDSFKYYSDSRVVLGYIHNTTRRFYNYVSNRVQRILCTTKAEQWGYINTKSNPADLGSRGCLSSDHLLVWLRGPDMLHTEDKDEEVEYPLISPEVDKEVRNEVVVKKTSTSKCITDTFKHFSSWKRLIIAFSVLKRAARNFKDNKNGKPKSDLSSTRSLRNAEIFILKVSQEKYFGEEVRCLQSLQSVNSKSTISSLRPYLDEEEIIRVGGRLNQGILAKELTNPVLMSRKDHVSKLLVGHFHEITNHQGRYFTEGAVRNGGYWIVGAKRLISHILYHCVTCRKLRGNTASQIMSDLPVDRLTPGPPFSYVGVDVFGPWEVVARRTRGGMAHSKRWAALFTCLTTRAVHIEVLEEMSSSSFINALHRFIAIRGNVKEFRSDRGTNFIGAMDDLKFNVVNVEDVYVAECLARNKVTWKFNPPHSSHMGGAWERMIGMSRKILDNMLSKSVNKHLTHEVLVTLMAEVMSILNSRPIAPISNPDNVAILTPSMLLNQKIDGDPTICIETDLPDMYKKQWKMVQVLSDMFWKQWRDNYLYTLQTRRKWKTQEVCIKNGDVVLLKDKNVPRAEWPIGVVINAIPSDSDKLVRKAEVRVSKHGRCSTLTRPITEMVLLVD